MQKKKQLLSSKISHIGYFYAIISRVKASLSLYCELTNTSPAVTRILHFYCLTPTCVECRLHLRKQANHQLYPGFKVSPLKLSSHSLRPPRASFPKATRRAFKYVSLRWPALSGKMIAAFEASLTAFNFRPYIFQLCSLALDLSLK